MAHYHEVNDTRTGDLLDLIVFCSDWCHRQWCQETANTYEGWNGCHELEFTDWCANCGEPVPGVKGAWDDLGAVI